jgi:hypothetical protein
MLKSFHIACGTRTTNAIERLREEFKRRVCLLTEGAYREPNREGAQS